MENHSLPCQALEWGLEEGNPQWIWNEDVRELMRKRYLSEENQRIARDGNLMIGILKRKTSKKKKRKECKCGLRWCTH
jgi:hypothetical protein